MLHIFPEKERLNFLKVLKLKLHYLQAEKEPDMNLWDIIKSSKLRVALTIGIVMHLSQQLSGLTE